MAKPICPFMSDKDNIVHCKENCMLYSYGKCAFVDMADCLMIISTPKEDDKNKP